MTRSDYEDRQEQRKHRLLRRSAKAEQEGQAAYDAAARIAKTIPMGQPILVGHHSERGHRADIKRIDRGMRKSIDKSKEADELQRRAEAIGTGGISSDDPEAVQKLQAKLDGLEQRQEWMKQVNAAWRKAGKPAPNDVAGWKKADDLLGVPFETLGDLRLEAAKRWHYAPYPFPPYALTNIGADLRRVRTRIQSLRQAAAAVSSEVDHGVCRVAENAEANRIQLLFGGKPDDAVRGLLKRYGFRWSPSESAWQRHLNEAGRLAARCVVDTLRKEVPDGNP